MGKGMKELMDIYVGVDEEEYDAVFSPEYVNVFIYT